MGLFDNRGYNNASHNIKTQQTSKPSSEIKRSQHNKHFNKTKINKCSNLPKRFLTSIMSLRGDEP